MDNFNARPRGATTRDWHLDFMSEVLQVGFIVVGVHLTVCRQWLCTICTSHWNAESSCIICNGENVPANSSFDERDDRAIVLESMNHFDAHVRLGWRSRSWFRLIQRNNKASTKPHDGRHESNSTAEKLPEHHSHDELNHHRPWLATSLSITRHY